MANARLYRRVSLSMPLSVSTQKNGKKVSLPVLWQVKVEGRQTMSITETSAAFGPGMQHPFSDPNFHLVTLSCLSPSEVTASDPSLQRRDLVSRRVWGQELMDPY